MSPSANDLTPTPSRHRNILWSGVLALLASIAVVFCGVCGSQILRAHAANRLLDSVDRLVLRSPTDCTRAEWQVAIYHTHNLHGAMIPQVHSARAELNELRAALEARAGRQSDLELIDGLWGEYCRIMPDRAKYAVRCRTMLNEQTDFVVTGGDVYDDYGSFERSIREEAARKREAAD